MRVGSVCGEAEDLGPSCQQRVRGSYLLSLGPGPEKLLPLIPGSWAPAPVASPGGPHPGAFPKGSSSWDPLPADHPNPEPPVGEEAKGPVLSSPNPPRAVGTPPPLRPLGSSWDPGACLSEVARVGECAPRAPACSPPPAWARHPVPVGPGAGGAAHPPGSGLVHPALHAVTCLAVGHTGRGQPDPGQTPAPSTAHGHP